MSEINDLKINDLSKLGDETVEERSVFPYPCVFDDEKEDEVFFLKK